MRMYAVALIALAGLCSPAIAQTQCPELTRLRAEAVAAAKPTPVAPAPRPLRDLHPDFHRMERRRQIRQRPS